MAAPTTNLFLLEELEDATRTTDRADSDLGALRAVANWINTFVVKPHKDLGRAGTAVQCTAQVPNTRRRGRS